MYDNIKRKRQQAKAARDKHAKPLPKLQVAEPVRLQPTNPKAPWEKGSCVPKVGPRSFLIKTEGRNLYRRNRKFIHQDPSHNIIMLHRTSVAQFRRVALHPTWGHQPSHYQFPRQILL